jgi:hypothetical protein
MIILPCGAIGYANDALLNAPYRVEYSYSTIEALIADGWVND